jgi:hypothetical protein
MSAFNGVIKLIDGSFYIKNLGCVTAPTGITLKKIGDRYHWVACRRASKLAKANGETSYYFAAGFDKPEDAWFAYRDAVKALLDHLGFLYRGRYFQRFEQEKKKIPTGKVGVCIFPMTGGGTRVVAKMGKSHLFQTTVWTDTQMAAAKLMAISEREKAEQLWLKEHLMTLAQALEVIDTSVSAAEKRRYKGRHQASASL